MEAPRRTRRYRMDTRAKAASATHGRILEAAIRQLGERFYDEVALADVAGEAGVTVQTVLRRFGSKEGLTEAAATALGVSRVRCAERWSSPPGASTRRCAGSSATTRRAGRASLRFLAQEERIPAMRGVVEAGRALHREWVEHAFAPWLAKKRGPARDRLGTASSRSPTSTSGRSSGATLDSTRAPRRRPSASSSPPSSPEGRPNVEGPRLHVAGPRARLPARPDPRGAEAARARGRGADALGGGREGSRPGALRGADRARDRGADARRLEGGFAPRRPPRGVPHLRRPRPARNSRPAPGDRERAAGRPLHRRELLGRGGGGRGLGAPVGRLRALLPSAARTRRPAVGPGHRAGGGRDGPAAGRAPLAGRAPPLRPGASRPERPARAGRCRVVPPRRGVRDPCAARRLFHGRALRVRARLAGERPPRRPRNLGAAVRNPREPAPDGVRSSSSPARRSSRTTESSWRPPSPRSPTSRCASWRRRPRSIDPASFRAPRNARVERLLPHGPLLGEAACVVCHGGMGITQKALAAGVPVCVVPFGRDQLEVARHVEQAGAGTRLVPGRLAPERFRRAVREAIGRAPGARLVAESFRRAGGARAAADAIEELRIPGRS